MGEERSQRAAPSFTAGLLLSLANPKGYAAMAALFSGFRLAGAASDVAVKIVAMTVVPLPISL